MMTKTDAGKAIEALSKINILTPEEIRALIEVLISIQEENELIKKKIKGI